METALIFMGLLIFSAHVFNALFEKTRIPSVLILIIIGIILGPLLNLISPASLGTVGTVFTTMTLITILYESGTELKLASIGKTVGGAAYLAVVNFIVAAIIGLGIGYFLLDFDVMSSLFLGAAAGGSVAATVVIPMLAQLNLGSKAKDIMSLESALSDVVCLVIALALFDAMTGKISLSVGIVAFQLIYSLIVAIVIGAILGLIWMIILRRYVSNLKHTMFTTFALAFILYGVCHLIHVNGAIATLAFGITIGNMGRVYAILNKRWPNKIALSNQREAYLKQDEKNFTGEIVFILQTYFYVYVGMSMQFEKYTYVMIALLFTTLIFVSRPFIIKGLGKKGFSTRDMKMMSILGPKGLVSAVLGSLPIQLIMQRQNLGEYVSDEEINQALTIQGISYATILISIILCSVLVFYLDKKTIKENVNTENPKNKEEITQGE